jgi:hypothetical protein
MAQSLHLVAYLAVVAPEDLVVALAVVAPEDLDLVALAVVAPEDLDLVALAVVAQDYLPQVAILATILFPSKEVKKEDLRFRLSQTKGPSTLRRVA